MSRLIQARVRTSALQVTDCVSSLLALEMLMPGRLMYLCAPVWRNAPILPNSLGQFGSLFPETETASMRLAGALTLLSDRGEQIRLLYSTNDTLSDEFLSQLSPHIECRGVSPLHYKGLVGESFYLRGAMRFTDFGVDIAEDEVELITRAEQVSLALLAMEQYWEEIA